MKTIREIDINCDIRELLNVIRTSFKTVADELNLTPENAPTNPAFITIEMLEKSLSTGLAFFVLESENKIIGSVAIQKGDKPGLFYIERLAVLPGYRHKGFGKELLDAAFEKIRERNGTFVSIGIINENIKLKGWYINYGFIEKSVKKFEHLPFTVCFMEKYI